MANKRMFSKDVIEADAFIDLPLSAQALYFHLSMAADDEGFVSGPKSVQRMIGASDDDAALLVRKGFVIPFPSGVVAIRHWRLNNYLQKDRIKPTVYIDERALLSVDDKKTYFVVENSTAGGSMYTECIQPVYIDKNRIDKNRYIERGNSLNSPRAQFGKFGKVLLTQEEHEELKTTYRNSHHLIDKVDRYLARSGREYADHMALIITIAEDDRWPKKPRTEDPTDLAEGAALPAGDVAKDLTAEQLRKMDQDVERITKMLAERLSGKE